MTIEQLNRAIEIQDEIKIFREKLDLWKKCVEIKKLCLNIENYGEAWVKGDTLIYPEIRLQQMEYNKEQLEKLIKEFNDL